MVSIVVMERTHGVGPVFTRGERMENIGHRLPFGDDTVTSTAANFRKSYGAMTSG